MHSSPSPGSTSSPIAPPDPKSYAMPCRILGCAGGYLFRKDHEDFPGRAVCDTCGDIRPRQSEIDPA